MERSKRGHIPYNPRLRAFARELRKNGTLGEVLLWQALQRKQLGVEFHRQVPIDEYIVDFYCHEYMLAIEVDGSGHDHEEAFADDMARQRRLESLGVRFLRFKETDVRDNVEGVVDAIRDWLKAEA